MITDKTRNSQTVVSRVRQINIISKAFTFHDHGFASFIHPDRTIAPTHPSPFVRCVSSYVIPYHDRHPSHPSPFTHEPIYIPGALTPINHYLSRSILISAQCIRNTIIVVSLTVSRTAIATRLVFPAAIEHLALDTAAGAGTSVSLLGIIIVLGDGEDPSVLATALDAFVAVLV